MSLALADSWAENAETPEGALLFLRKYGKVLEFRHIGIFRTGNGADGTARYVSEPFGVFFTQIGKNIEVHQLDRDYLKLLITTCHALPSNTVNDEIKSKVASAINRAMKDFNTHLDHLPDPNRGSSLQNNH